MGIKELRLDVEGDRDSGVENNSSLVLLVLDGEGEAFEIASDAYVAIEEDTSPLVFAVLAIKEDVWSLVLTFVLDEEAIALEMTSDDVGFADADRDDESVGGSAFEDVELGVSDETVVSVGAADELSDAEESSVPMLKADEKSSDANVVTGLIENASEDIVDNADANVVEVESGLDT